MKKERRDCGERKQTEGRREKRSVEMVNGRCEAMRAPRRREQRCSDAAPADGLIGLRRSTRTSSCSSGRESSIVDETRSLGVEDGMKSSPPSKVESEDRAVSRRARLSAELARAVWFERCALYWLIHNFLRVFGADVAALDVPLLGDLEELFGDAVLRLLARFASRRVRDGTHDEEVVAHEVLRVPRLAALACEMGGVQFSQSAVDG